ncbi:MAG: glucose-6-phosphate isomerase, partial [Clostridia bacterium]|nr:glucose-6-phosphate isomerase [Clostridia bacterium]
MSVRLNTKYVESFLADNALESVKNEVEKAHNDLKNGTGKGNDFLGWLTLPKDYDKNEFNEIKKAAEEIKKTSEVLVVVGIGGSYLGARAVIEFIKSQ